MRQTVLQQSAMRLISAVFLLAGIGACGDPEVRPTAGGEGAATAGPPVVVTVSHGRSVQVEESNFTESGLHRGPTTSLAENRASLMVGEPGQTMTRVSMKSDSLIFIHVDASVPNDNTILVYGSYDPEIAGLIQASSPRTKAALFSMESTEATKAGWECIWCRGGILACGVDPECGR